MRKCRLPLRGWVLAVIILAAGGAGWWRGTPARALSRASILDAGRRLNGDIIVLSMTDASLPLGQVQELAAHTNGIARAELVSHLGVQIESRSFGASSPNSVVLEFASFDPTSSRFEFRGARRLQPRSKGMDVQVAVGKILAAQFQLSLGDVVTITVPSKGATPRTAAKRCKVVSIVETGFDYFDSRLMITDLSYLADFGWQPSGVSILLSSPEARIGFAAKLQQQWGTGLRVIPLEELLEPLLRGAL